MVSVVCHSMQPALHLFALRRLHRTQKTGGTEQSAGMHAEVHEVNLLSNRIVLLHSIKSITAQYTALK